MTDNDINDVKIINNIFDNSSEFDELKMYFGEDYWVTDKIVIHQPTIGNILEFGDSKFYSTVSTLCANPTSFRLQLWDIGIDWNSISDFELFMLLSKSLKPKDTYLLFGDLNFSWFEQYMNQQNNEVCLIYTPRDENDEIIPITSYENAIIINELVYTKIVKYLRQMFDIHPKIEKAITKDSKETIINDERIDLEYEKKKKKNKNETKSFLFPLVSAMVNHPGFKYKKNELKEVGIVEFMDSVKRLQTYESVRALMSGMYSGMLDTSKMNLNKELNWARDIYQQE